MWYFGKPCLLIVPNLPSGKQTTNLYGITQFTLTKVEEKYTHTQPGMQLWDYWKYRFYVLLAVVELAALADAIAYSIANVSFSVLTGGVFLSLPDL